ncbi:MAG TPA: hypothetical protein VFE41_27015 [Acetobacteraceae bacterium]|jgi:flagellum-specific ATP synthase|nr:hypothetical protein [Acetobacteraceae bacterium]
MAVADAWLGRVVDPLGAPLDDRGRLALGPIRRVVRAAPPPATARARLGPRIDLGVRAVDLFATCRQGQRLGLFAGSGVGKSTLLGMLARQAVCDVAVLAWSASADAGSANSLKMISAPTASCGPWWWLPRPTPRRCCATK